MTDLLGNCPGNGTTQGFSGVLFSQMINWMLNFQCDLGNPNTYPKDISHPLEEYDFIIVGAGSAGSVVASRLSEISDWNILLIEAGGNPTATSDIPALISLNDFDVLDWKYTSEPEPGVCQGYRNKTCSYNRGKGLGGSSLINYLLYVRGNRNDFDNWERMGNQGWGYNTVLNYFKKSEDMRIPKFMNSTYHQTGGYMGLEVGNDPLFENVTNMLLNAAKQIGLPTGHDINGESQTGYSEVPSFICNGTRCNVAKAFLSPAKNRSNLHVMKNAYVTKLLIGKDKQVYGVEVVKRGEYYNISSKYEVILSAGAIGSPQILMHSGIGPEEHLKEIGIDVVQNLKVGENLKDHFFLNGLFYAFKPFNIMRGEEQTNFFNSHYEYLTTRSGSLSKLSTLMLTGFINTTEKHFDWPDLQSFNLYIPANSTQLQSFIDFFGFDTELSETLLTTNKKYDLMFASLCLLRPKAVGKILLRDKNPYSYPKIYSGFLQNSEDIAAGLRSINFLKTFVKTDPLKKRNAFYIKANFEKCNKYNYDTDEYWICYMQHLGSTTLHLSGTCKMGPSSDPTAVVDPRLRVYGMKGLRVVDASIMPLTVSGNTNAATIMIGEKGSDLIKDDWMFTLR